MYIYNIFIYVHLTLHQVFSSKQDNVPDFFILFSLDFKIRNESKNEKRYELMVPVPYNDKIYSDAFLKKSGDNSVHFKH